MKLSICIPTYNRAQHLVNCLESIYSIRSKNKFQLEICVSDNASIDDTELIVMELQSKMSIKYTRNSTNLGIPQNFLNVINMATGEFVWLIGDDDLLLPDTLDKLLLLFENNKDVDFFYINSYHLHTEYVLSFPQPFNTKNLPLKMEPFSSYTKTGKLNFIDLINPKISFDFLGGMFLSVFKRTKWQENINVLNPNAIVDLRTFSYFDNTFPHIKIFAKAFSNSNAFFSSEPLSICLTGAREWSPMYPFVHSVRLVEALEEYKKNGLPYFKYLWCRNFALNSFIPDMFSMYIYRDVSGFKYINPLKLIIKNCLYPNFYFSFFKFFIRKIINMIDKMSAKFFIFLIFIY
jgi:glycosyltransferase involved in cell wall biosynthesis